MKKGLEHKLDFLKSATASVEARPNWKKELAGIQKPKGGNMSDKFYFKRTLEMVSEFDGTKSINHAEKLNNDPVMFDYVLLESNGVYVGLDYLVGDDGLEDVGLFLPLTNLLDEFIERKDPDEMGDMDSIHDINELVCEFELCIAKLNRLKAKIIKNEILTKQYGDNMGYTTEEGIKAIIDLQSMYGVDESYDDALKGWNSMSKSEKETTENVHKMMFPEAGKE